MQKPVQQIMQSLAHGLAGGSFRALVCSSFQPKDFRAIASQTQYPLFIERPGSPPFLRTPNGIQGDTPELLQFRSVQSLSNVRLFTTSWTTARQVSLSITNFQSLLKLISTESVIPSNHLILCRPLLFLPSIFPSIRVFSNESALHIRWPKYWSFSFNISPSSEYSGLISFRID